MIEFDSVGDLYENALMMANGESLEYGGLTVGKAEWPHPEHTEYKVLNEDDEKVESLTISAYDSVDELQDYLDEIADYGPEDLEDWTSRGEDL